LNLINNRGWEQRFPYKSLMDVPDKSYSTGNIAKVELNRALQFHWANYTSRDGMPVVINSKGEEVIKYSKEGVDYYVTKEELNEPILFEEGGIKVYKLRKNDEYDKNIAH
jgi:hypothetical protein